ncbi:DnaJ domain protein (macronuclear) [Tetrahymena thermophila SB210]|uniref:DnaJ domain protein n=1 Tax=Tetrahymena thermophila (strain SB210) TaxID=312017 RepID=Q22L38_TETTS|nr:DnaJ domain protein [Tetrahymena thermophila SB210]EAR85979.2 DnaJ domain protein [Tetrahymena thermophila SB210]|eukprot:XP_976574.2 DnaJ domain protein [Tetrahymena thermophila SB210]
MGRLSKNSSKDQSKQQKQAEKKNSKSTKKQKKDLEEEEEDEVEDQLDNEDNDLQENNDDEDDDEQDKNGGSENTEKKITLYDLLDIEKDATIEQIKKAYKKLALKIHPDKNKDDPQAKEKFQKIVEAYNILSDPEKKKVYDETGSYGDDFNQHAFEAAYNFYRAIYKKIEKEDIIEFEKKYRGSDMEEEDLINFYNENDGDLTTILECIPLSRNEDVDRFLQKYEELFKANKLKKTKAFAKTKSKIILLEEDEEEGFEEQQNGLKDLAQQILAKKGDALSFLDSLAEKYGGLSSKKTKKADTSSGKKSMNGQKKK